MFISKIFLLLIALILVICLLCSDIEATTDQRVRIDIVDRGAVYTLYEYVAAGDAASLAVRGYWQDAR